MSSDLEKKRSYPNSFISGVFLFFGVPGYTPSRCAFDIIEYFIFSNVSPDFVYFLSEPILCIFCQNLREMVYPGTPKNKNTPEMNELG